MQGTDKPDCTRRRHPDPGQRSKEMIIPVAAAGAGAAGRLFRRAADLRLEGVCLAALGASLLGVIVNGAISSRSR